MHGTVAESSAMDDKLKSIHGIWLPAIHLCPKGYAGMTMITRNIDDFEPTGVEILNPWLFSIV